MHIDQDKLLVNKFVNHYCDGIYCALSEFITVDDENYDKILKNLSYDEKESLIEYAVAKNTMAGVGRLNIKVPEFGMGIKMLDKYELKGKEIVSAKNFNSMPTSSLIGGRTILDIENLLDYSQNVLSDISDFSARADVPLAIEISSDLENVGKIVNMYNSSPVRVLEDFGFLDRECFVYGLNYLDKDDQKLIKDYDKLCVFSPQDDGEQGKGAINLFNFIYNRLKFGFSSGKCYNIDMLFESKLARINTFNLMHESGIITPNIIIDALTDSECGLLDIGFSINENQNNVFDKKVKLEVKNADYLQKKSMEIAKKIKENI